MKAKNLNNSSKKTKKLIKKVFAEMLSQKKSLSNISVSELCKRAELSRGAFYSHYDDIYAVAEEYENELIDAFFDKSKFVNSQNITEFLDSIFEYIRQNDENYRKLCQSNEIIYAAKKLRVVALDKLLELCLNDENIKNRTYAEMDIRVFLDGLFCEYARYCRGEIKETLDDLYEYTKFWVFNFISQRSI